MNQFLNKPYKSIWFSIPIVLGLSIPGFNSVIDIQMHDTYFVISSIHLGILFSLLLGIIGLMYWFFRKKRLVEWMKVIHVLSTIAIFILIVLTGKIFIKVIQSDYETFRAINQITFVLIVIAMLSQLLFILNLVISIIKNKLKD